MSLLNTLPQGGASLPVKPPTVTNLTIGYDGQEHGPTIQYNEDYITITGTTKATAQGTYHFTASLIDPTNMMWLDTKNSEDREYTWEITLPIYGAEWDGSSSPTWTRTDSAADFTDPNPYYAGMSGTPSSPFDTISPWKDIRRVTDSTLGELVEIPKYYYKWTADGDSLKLQISEAAFTGSSVSPAHANRGDGQGERDVVYVGRYHCASDYKSKTGVLPLAEITRATARTAISALKTGAYQYDYAMFWTIAMLYLVEFANWDSQSKIGYGTWSIYTGIVNMGYTDSMTYHTGTIQNSRSVQEPGTQYRYIEGLWDNLQDWCDGIYFAEYMGNVNKGVYVINNPVNFSDTTGGTFVGAKASDTGKLEIMSWRVPDVQNLTWALYPKTVIQNTNYDTYVCDAYRNNISGTVLAISGPHLGTYGPGGGLFNFNSNYPSTQESASFGTRLMYLPPN